MQTQMSYSFRMMSTMLGLVLAMGLVAGCKRGDKNLEPMGTDDTDRASVEGSGSEGLNPNLELERLLFGPSGLQPVYFDFDSSSLNATALRTLAENAEKIKQVPNVIIQIAGHCDERGTQEYNLALGERRALSVREHLRQLGVSGDRMITISFGEENPAVLGSNEAAWAKNRRCEFLRANAM
ncbi:MAG: peptidoglycan-associated lipoprotein Pal [Candidatus Hydrogenedentes bacterium]|nr:peptidoglycan-associated lipoprotein Pal [Candidatus Hydrogenedentota bacterium]